MRESMRIPVIGLRRGAPGGKMLGRERARLLFSGRVVFLFVFQSAWKDVAKTQLCARRANPDVIDLPRLESEGKRRHARFSFSLAAAGLVRLSVWC